QAIQIWEKAGVPRHSDVGAALSNLGLVYSALDRHVSAEEVLRRALEIDEETLGPNHPHTAGTLVNLATTLRKLDRRKEAQACEKRARAVLEQNARENLTDLAVDVQAYKR